jgi:hypothetical protein
MSASTLLATHGRSFKVLLQECFLPLIIAANLLEEIDSSSELSSLTMNDSFVGCAPPTDFRGKSPGSGFSSGEFSSLTMNDSFAVHQRMDTINHISVKKDDTEHSLNKAFREANHRGVVRSSHTTKETHLRNQKS